MKRLLAALGLVLAFSAIMPRDAAAQDTRVRTSKGSLGQNYPNPFNPETRFNFGVGDPPVCTEAGKLHRVTVKIFNQIAQLVAVPVLQGGGAVAGGQPLENLSLPCGEYIAYWDGKVQSTGREAASGIYLYRLEVDGVPMVKKMINVK